MEGEISAQPKKEKLKKKWSFRSISFGKKDKQKPQKKEKKLEEEKAVVEENVVEAVNEGAASAVSTVEIKIEEVLEPTPLKEECAKTSEKEKPVEPVREVATEVVKVREEEGAIPTEKATIAEKTVEETKEMEPEVEKSEIETKPEIVEPVKQLIQQETAENPPTMPTTPPPSQASVFAESLTEGDSFPEETTEKIEMKSEEKQIDLEPVAQMVEKVLEEAAETVENELSEKSEEFPDPPVDDNSDATTDTPGEPNTNEKMDSPIEEVSYIGHTS